MARRWYEVRVREQIGPDKWVKKSKFYKTNGPREAAQKYKGRGNIMWVNKVPKEKALGVGSFFSLGGDLLEDLRKLSGEEIKKSNKRFNRNKRRALNG